MIKSVYRTTAELLMLSFSVFSVGAFAQSSVPGATVAPSAGGSNSRQINGATVDPAAGPQSPDAQQSTTAPSPASDQSVPPAAMPGTVVPDAPAPRQALPIPPPTQAPAQDQNQTQNQPQEPPAGAATAEKGVTRGGVASRPAGVAIAPAKQRQMRSLLIKTGAIIFGAVAIGTVYALHRSTSSYPPGSGH